MSTLKTGTVQNNTGTGAPLFKNNSGTEIGQLVRFMQTLMELLEHHLLQKQMVVFVIPLMLLL